jgi:hypothetical protein
MGWDGDGILLALKRLCSKSSPRKRETHDLQRVLDLLESDYSKVIPKMDDVSTVLCTYEDRSRGRTLGLQVLRAVAAHSLDGCSASPTPVLYLLQPWPLEDEE